MKHLPFQVLFNRIIRDNYVLQVSPDLVTPAWSNASGPLTATAAVLNAVATNAMPINYYRAVRTD